VEGWRGRQFRQAGQVRKEAAVTNFDGSCSTFHFISPTTTFFLHHVRNGTCGVRYNLRHVLRTQAQPKSSQNTKNTGKTGHIEQICEHVCISGKHNKFYCGAQENIFVVKQYVT